MSKMSDRCVGAVLATETVRGPCNVGCGRTAGKDMAWYTGQELWIGKNMKTGIRRKEEDYQRTVVGDENKEDRARKNSVLMKEVFEIRRRLFRP